MPRYMKKQTIEELKVFIMELLNKNKEASDDDFFDGYEEEAIEDILMYMVMDVDSHIGMSGIIKDLYKSGGFENADFPKPEELPASEKTIEQWHYHKIEWAGFHTLEGRTFYGGFLSQDWTEPAFVAFYQDDKGVLRAYMPKKGNGFNPLNKLSFRDDNESDDKYARSKGFKDFEDMEQKNPVFIAELYDSEIIKQELLKRLVVR